MSTSKAKSSLATQRQQPEAATPIQSLAQQARHQSQSDHDRRARSQGNVSHHLLRHDQKVWRKPDRVQQSLERRKM
jgi:hypothetical protein